MKNFIAISAIAFILSMNCWAQNDTLVINLKSNQADKIALNKIQKMTFVNLTGVKEISKGESSLIRIGNYPNPFEMMTNIEFNISAPGNAEVNIYNNSGNIMQTLKCMNCPEGRNSIQWDCRDRNGNQMQSGVYYYEIRFNSEIQSKKMILIK